ncbi:MAG TPA: hypothetical protein VGJ91_17810 [Polyangiaceae bacterium]|jgi:hypothetical protein
MLLEDLFLGWAISKLFGNKGEETRSPAVTFPANGQAAPATTPPATTAPPQFPAQVPVTTTAPATATPAAAPATAPQGTPAPAGFKRAIEVWQVKPSLAQQGTAAISGMGEQVGAMALAALEAQFPNGWQAMRSATAEEAAKAKALLAQWKDGGVVFAGPATLPGRRAFKMTKHPGTPATAPAPQAAAPAPSQASFPTGVTVPEAAPAAAAPAPPTTAPPAPAPVVTRTPGGGTVTTLPEVLITADAPGTGPTPSTPVNQITRVRKGEGLANVAKRLGQPATGTSATVLQKANLPGPDGWYTAQALDKGGLKKKNRAGGLQPGDRLFVPPQWGPVDPARL